MATTEVLGSKLRAYEDIVAGQASEGVLIDESGGLLFKPCKPCELAFYQAAAAQHESFTAIMPKFLGTLQLQQEKELEKIVETVISTTPASQLSEPQGQPPSKYPVTLPSGAQLQKRIDSDTALVLENLTDGFLRPNILDLKLGRRLWADDASEATRQRRDMTTEVTTCKSLAFYIAGMKIYDGTTYMVRPKNHVRSFDEQGVRSAFQEFFDIAGSSGAGDEVFREVIPGVIEAVEEIAQVVRDHETRIYSSSLLLVYEGDRKARDMAMDALAHADRSEGIENDVTSMMNENDNDNDDDEDDDISRPKCFESRLIDFAHAKFTPGQGPDENMLEGIGSILTILRELEQHVACGGIDLGKLS